MEDQKQDLNFYLVSAIAAIVDAVSINQSRIRMRIAVTLAVLSVEAGVILFTIVIHSFTSEAAILGIGVGVIAVIWSLYEMQSVLRKERESRLALASRVEDLAKLSGGIVESAGSSDISSQFDGFARSENRFKWRIIQSYLRTLEHIASDK